MRYAIMAFIGMIAFGLVHRDKGGKMEYLCALILWILACIGLLFL